MCVCVWGVDLVTLFLFDSIIIVGLLEQITWFLRLLHLAVNDPKHDKTLKMLQPLALKVQPIVVVASEPQSRATSSTNSSRARTMTSPVAPLASPLAAATAAAAAAVVSMRGKSRPVSAQSSRCDTAMATAYGNEYFYILCNLCVCVFPSPFQAFGSTVTCCAHGNNCAAQL